MWVLGRAALVRVRVSFVFLGRFVVRGVVLGASRTGGVSVFRSWASS